MRTTLRTFALLASAAALAACGDGGTTPEPKPSPLVLQVASGDAQPGFPGWPLGEPLVVRVTRDGVAVPFVAVSFAATGGSVDAATLTTDANGLAAVNWTLPATDAEIAAARVTARPAAAEGATVTFSARRMRPDEQDLVIAPGAGPVRMLIYDSGSFSPTTAFRATFTDSTRLPPLGPAAAWDEITVFAPGRAPAMTTVAWTPKRDTVRVTFPEMVRIPLTIWVVETPFDSVMQLVRRHLDGVAQTWEAQGGIGLSEVRIVDATGFPEAAQFRGAAVPSCSQLIATAIGRDAGRMNAYYIGSVRIGEIIPSAAYCNGGSMEIYPLAWQRWPYTLAHEIGHGLLGAHHETLPNNVMHFRGDGATFSPGQIWVAHYWNQSILNTMFNAHPLEKRRACGQFGTGGPCPTTSFVLD